MARDPAPPPAPTAGTSTTDVRATAGPRGPAVLVTGTDTPPTTTEAPVTTTRRDEDPAPRARGDALPSRVRDLAAPLAEDLGVDLVDVEVKGQAGRRVVKLIADSLEVSEEVGVDTIATLSRRVGDALDETDLVPGAYTLEVTSPGATRPLTSVRDFARNVGREVVVQRREDAGEPAEVRGEVVATDDDGVTLTTADGQVRLPLVEVEHGTVVLPW